MKKSKMGSNPLDWIQDSRGLNLENEQKDYSIVEEKEEKVILKPKEKPAPVGRPSKIKLAKNDFTKKTTYYIKNSNIKKLKILGVEIDRDQSYLVNQAIEMFLEENSKTL